jgi:ABC-type multidrug transport system fused ATPase/permease subunit
MRSGKSGSGKSSAQSLLLRFFDVSIAVDYKYETLTHISAAGRCGTRYL